MFGESEILGTKEITVDSKARITIPKFTGVEPKDQLVCCELTRNSFVIASLEALKAELAACKKTGDTVSVRLIERKLEDLYTTVIDVAHVDKQNRIFIPELIRENFLPFNYKETRGTIVAQGLGNRLKLHLDAKAFIQKQKEV